MKQRQQKKLSRRLFEAVLTGDGRSTKALLRGGASPDKRNSDGTTPLYLASVQGEAEVARLLMEAGASPDTESSGPGSEGTPRRSGSCWPMAPIPTSAKTTAPASPRWTGRTTGPTQTLPPPSGQQGRNPRLTQLRNLLDLNTHVHNRP
ncbi:ankyrin repeat domain-containing protein [Streptomyces sp. NPDC001002]